MADIVKGQIGNALESVAPDGIVATADAIYDETKGKYQEQINAEVGDGLNAQYHNTGYYECGTAAATAAKTVNASGYQLPATAPYGGSIKVKFTNKNSAANPTLSINQSTPKPLYYNGAIASASNTWDDNDVLELYYDGTNFNAKSVVEKFATGEKVKNVGIDSEPTAESANLVKSGGVQNELALGAVYDVSAKNPTAGPNNDGKWESLSTLLSDANLNTLIPTAVRKGGMSIKFVQSYDNKYIQARCMAQNFTTDVTKWQGVDDEPVAGSDNLVKSGGVYEKVSQLGQETAMIGGQDLTKFMVVGKYINTYVATGSVVDTTPIDLPSFGCICVPYFKGKTIKISGTGGSAPQLYAFLDKDKKMVSHWSGTATDKTISENVEGYLVLNFNLSEPYSVFVDSVSRKEFEDEFESVGTRIDGLDDDLTEETLKVSANTDYYAKQIIHGTENFIDLDEQTGDNIEDNTCIYMDGTHQSNTAFYVSSFIKVIPNTTYKAVRVANPNYASLGAFYDINKQQLSVIDYGGAPTPISPNVVTFTTPANCYFVRLNMFKTETDKMLVFGDSNIDTYRNYGYDYKPILNRQPTIDYSVIWGLYPFRNKIGSFIGDSITWGYTPVGTPGQGEQITNNWVKLVSERLLLGTSNNYGISGSVIAVKESDPTTRSPMVDRVDSVDANSDLIVVAGGTNDWSHSWAPFGDTETEVGTTATKYTFCGALDILCRELITRFPTKKIAFLTPIKRDYNSANSFGKTLGEYADAIKVVCGRYGIPVFDMFNEVCINPYFTNANGAAPRNQSPQYSLLIPDGTHPNEDGHAFMASRIFGFLNNL